MLTPYQSRFQTAPKGRPNSTQDPFQLAIQSAQRLRDFGVQIPPKAPVAPLPFVPGTPKPTPPAPGYDGSGINPGGLYDPPTSTPPKFITGAQSATAPPPVVPPPSAVVPPG